MSNSCCICGTVRDCGKYLNKIFENMELIGSLFQEYKIFIFYDKSNDDTLEILNLYKEKNINFSFYENTFLLDYRTHRIALGRNKCLEFIRENCPQYNYFIMMDCDDRCAKNMNIGVLNYYLHRSSGWDALSFNHPDGYYDTWALSIYPYVLSCHHFKHPCKGKRLIEKLINQCPPNKLIPCYSAFNGFSIYKTSKFVDCAYDGRFRIDYVPRELVNKNIKVSGKMNMEQNNEDCEHRIFHFEAKIKNKANIMISPHNLFI